jgi:hypothetical protein
VLNASSSDVTYQFKMTQNMPKFIAITTNTGFQLPGYSSLYAAIHLDYAKKGTIQTSQIYSAADALKTTVSGTSNPNSGKKDAYGSVAFLSKKTTIIYGFVKTCSGSPIDDARIELWRCNTLLYTANTDDDGFYAFINGWNGVTLQSGVLYTLKCYIPSSSVKPYAVQLVLIKTDMVVAVNFTKRN